MKKIISVFLIMYSLFYVCPYKIVVAPEEIASGVCGDDIT